MRKKAKTILSLILAASLTVSGGIMPEIVFCSEAEEQIFLQTFLDKSILLQNSPLHQLTKRARD
jgi:hypothetical protein